MKKNLKKYIKKIIKASIIYLIIMFAFYIPSYADDELEEADFTWSEIEKVINSSTDVHEIPEINSRVAVIYDRASGNVIYGKEENKRYKMASTTKIMTAIVVIENSNLTDIVEVSRKSATTGGSRLGLSYEDKITVNDLLYGLMLCSGNDAAVALAEHVGGDIQGFAELMNKKAQELGLSNTHFVTPHGLDEEEHYTTAYELAKIADYALKNETFKKIVGTKEYGVSINGNYKMLSNTNELLGNLNGVYGVKTGFTNGANRCLVTATKRENLDVICVVLGADTKKFRTQDSIKLIEYAFSNYETVNIKEKIEDEFNSWNTYNKIEVIKGEKNYIQSKLEEVGIENMAINKDEIKDIQISINAINNLEAPIEENKKVGELIVNIKDKTICKLDIFVKEGVKRKTAKYYFKEFIKNYTLKLEENIL